MVISMCSITTRHLARILNPPNTWVRIGVSSGGCSGFKYEISPTNESPLRTDEVVSTTPPVYVCGASVFRLLGTRLVWTEDALGARIEFDNPNAHSSCGCGDSFS